MLSLRPRGEAADNRRNAREYHACSGLEARWQITSGYAQSKVLNNSYVLMIIWLNKLQSSAVCLRGQFFLTFFT